MGGLAGRGEKLSSYRETTLEWHYLVIFLVIDRLMTLRCHFKMKIYLDKMYHQVALSLCEYHSVSTQIYMGKPAICVGYVVHTITLAAITDEI